MAHSYLSFDTQNPNPNLEGKMVDVLCIFSYRRAILLKMDEILRQEDYKEGTSLKLPPLKRILDFVQMGLPLGMGLLKCGNFLYMFGGEFPSDYPSLLICPREDYCLRSMVSGAGIPKENPFCPAFRLDLTWDNSKPVQFRSMLGPKLYPVVEQIGDLIYVLSDRLLSSSRPMFEVWNLRTEEWRALPNPPPFSEGDQIRSHCVSGRDIICVIGVSLIYRFSTVSETWVRIAELSSHEGMALNRRFDVRFKDFYIERRRFEKDVWAIMDGPEEKDCYSVAVDDFRSQPHVPGFQIGDGPTLADTSEPGNYMCGLMPYVPEDIDMKGFLLYVFVYQVEKLESEKVTPSQAPLSVRYLRRQVYDFTFRVGKEEEIPVYFFSKAVVWRLWLDAPTGSGECSWKSQILPSSQTDYDWKPSRMAHSYLSFDMQNPNPNPNPNPNLEGKMVDVLCIFCYRRAILLKMDVILRQEDYKEGTSLKPPPLKRILDFVQLGLPLGMGLLKCGNFLYMFGGEYPREEHCPRSKVSGAGIPEQKLLSPAFRLDLTCDNSEPSQLPSMLGPKLYPVVEQIGDLIYVLSDRRLSSCRPMFEVWNPRTEKWRALPNPPPFSESCQIFSHCVTGRDIICTMGFSHVYRFSTVSETWEREGELSFREQMALNGNFDVQCKGFYIKRYLECKDVWAIMDGPEAKDHYSIIIDDSGSQPLVPGFEIGDGPTLADSSEQGNYKCGLMPYVAMDIDMMDIDDTKGFLLYVFVYQVEKLESEKVTPSQAPLSVRYLRRQVYDFTFLVGKDEEIPTNSFSKAVVWRLPPDASTGSGEYSWGKAKRKRKEVDDDNDDEDEGQVVSTMDYLSYGFDSVRTD